MTGSRVTSRAARGPRMLLLGSLTLAIVAGPAPLAASAAGIDDDGVGVHVEITPRPGQTTTPGDPGGSGGSGSGSGQGGSGQLSSTGFDALGLLAATGMAVGLAGGILTAVGRRGRPDRAADRPQPGGM